MNEQPYIGSELGIFAQAKNWKAYYGSFLKKYLKGEVLEVGAGIGATTEVLCDGSQKKWVCLEPDPSLCKEIQSKIERRLLPNCCTTITGVIEQVGSEELFDAIIYIDVLEHIEQDSVEALNASKHLKSGGVLIVLSPAHQWLYTPFDKAIGHYRRYTKKSLKECMPKTLRQVVLQYWDSAGLLASLANRFFLRSAMPTAKQIKVWDSYLVPISRVLDPLFGRNIGKSIIGIWRNESSIP